MGTLHKYRVQLGSIRIKGQKICYLWRFYKDKKQAEDTYFALCEKILGRKPELADHTDWEEANRGYEYQMEWVEIMDEHIVDCSIDLNQIVSWKRNDFLSEYGDAIWYENGERMLERKESYIYDRNPVLNTIDTKNTLIEFKTVIDLFDEFFYLDMEECTGYFTPGIMQAQYMLDIEKLHRESEKNFIRLQMWELRELEIKHVVVNREYMDSSEREIFLTNYEERTAN